MKAIKVTNPLYIGQLTGYLQEFCKKVFVPGMTYETLYTFLCKTAQYGGFESEVWVVVDEQPLALAQWSIRGLPYIGVTHFGFLSNWSKAPGVVNLLIDEWIKYGLEHNCPIYEGDVRNPAVLRLIMKYATQRGYELTDTGLINFVIRRKL